MFFDVGFIRVFPYEFYMGIQVFFNYNFISNLPYVHFICDFTYAFLMGIYMFFTVHYITDYLYEF